MRLVSWNVAGRRDGSRAPRLTRQADAIASEDPDVVALQEVTRESDPQWRGALADRGLAHVASTTHLLAPGRRYANLLASRWPLDVLSLSDAENDFPERLLAAELHHPELGVEVHVFHAPTGVGAGWGKIRALEALHRLLEVASDLPRVVCGDFNAPQAEPPGRPLVTFAQDAATGELRRRPERWYRDVEPDVPWDPERWDQAERQILAPHESDLIDVYRLLHPDGQDHSWVWRGRGHEVARRFDHVFASRTLQPQSIRYRHDWRQRSDGQQLSDHSGVAAEFSAAPRS